MSNFDLVKFYLTFIPTPLSLIPAPSTFYQGVDGQTVGCFRIFFLLKPIVSLYCLFIHICLPCFSPATRILLHSCHSFASEQDISTSFQQFFPPPSWHHQAARHQWFTSSSPAFHLTNPISDANNGHEQLCDTLINIGFRSTKALNVFEISNPCRFCSILHSDAILAPLHDPSVPSIQIIFDDLWWRHRVFNIHVSIHFRCEEWRHFPGVRLRNGVKLVAQMSSEVYLEEAGDKGVSTMYDDVIKWFNHHVINAAVAINFE